MEAAARFPDGDSRHVALDLSRDDARRRVARALAGRDGVCITCFELIEHLDNFAPLVRFLIERAEAGATVVLSVPNDASDGRAEPVPRDGVGRGVARGVATLLPEHES